MNQTHQSERFALGTFSIAGCAPFVGIVMDERVSALGTLQSFFSKRGVAAAWLAQASMLELLEDWPQTFTTLSAAATALRNGEIDGASFVDMSILKVHAPLDARQIFCCGANYRQHVIDIIMDMEGPETKGMDREQRRAFAEKLMDERAATGKPYIFNKLPTSITGPFDTIVLPPNVKEPDWELELAVILGRPARHVSRECALDYVAGYTIANDTSSRDLLFRQDLKAMGTDWVASKNPPSWAPLGPYLVPAAFVQDPQNLQMTLQLNGEIKQDAKTSDMIFDIARQIEYLSELVQLLPGDVICTGSPAGNGTHWKRFLRSGDLVECTIEGLGSQRNLCAAELAPRHSPR